MTLLAGIFRPLPLGPAVVRPDCVDPQGDLIVTILSTGRAGEEVAFQESVVCVLEVAEEEVETLHLFLTEFAVVVLVD